MPGLSGLEHGLDERWVDHDSIVISKNQRRRWKCYEIDWVMYVIASLLYDRERERVVVTNQDWTLSMSEYLDGSKSAGPMTAFTV